MTRLRVGVLFGGPSAEHEVSCASALAVLRALDPERYEPVAIGVTRDGGFVLVPELLPEPPAGGPAIEDRLEVEGEAVELRSARPERRALVTSVERPEKVLAELDVVFPVLHGPFGEDGVIQGFLEAIGVPYVGCGIVASAVGMDKVAMKRAFRAEGIPITPHVWTDETRRDLDGIDGLRRPLFVKPANMGSSIGISRVGDGDDLDAALETAFRHDAVVLVEQGVTAREIECAVLGGTDPEASAVGEVVVAGGWFDYEQKYFGIDDPMIVPADLPHGRGRARA